MWQQNPDASKRDSKRIWGLSLESLVGPDLFPVDEKFKDRPDLTINLREKLLPYADLIEEYHGYPRSLIERSPAHLAAFRKSKRIIDDPTRLKEISRRLPLEPFWSECSWDEIAKIVFGDVIMSELGSLFDRMDYERIRRGRHGEIVEKGPMPEFLEFIYKLRNSMHHYGEYQQRSWNDLVSAYYAIPEFDFGPEFDVRFDHSRYFNWWGRAYHIGEQIRKMEMPWDEKSIYWDNNELYIDGVFAYLIYYKGKHVLTLGFSLGGKKVLLSQVQLRNQRGNRWLYKLPLDYFDYAVTRFSDHFRHHGFDVCLVQGQSLADQIASWYGEEAVIDPAAYKRIIKNYSKPLTHYYRGPEYQRKMKWYQLQPVPNM